MMSEAIQNAIVHLREARQLLLLEAYRVTDDGEIPAEHFTIAEELDRIDRAIGPRGESMFGRLSDRVRGTYVEITAALNALQEHPNDR